MLQTTGFREYELPDSLFVELEAAPEKTIDSAALRLSTRPDGSPADGLYLIRF
jgi:hypothetical protein